MPSVRNGGMVVVAEASAANCQVPYTRAIAFQAG
jgi:hypothetical protein